MTRQAGDKPDTDKFEVEPPKPRRPMPPPSRPLKDKRKEAERRKAREKIRPEQDDE